MFLCSPHLSNLCLAEFNYFQLPLPPEPRQQQTLALALEQGSYTAVPVEPTVDFGESQCRVVDALLEDKYLCVLFCDGQPLVPGWSGPSPHSALQVWRRDDLEHPHTLTAETRTLMYGLSLDGDHLALVHNCATVRVFDLRAGITLVREYALPQGMGPLTDLGRAALSEHFVAASDARNIVIWVRETGSVRETHQVVISIQSGTIISTTRTQISSFMVVC